MKRQNSKGEKRREGGRRRQRTTCVVLVMPVKPGFNYTEAKPQPLSGKVWPRHIDAL
jgi:hypothetical protein